MAYLTACRIEYTFWWSGYHVGGPRSRKHPEYYPVDLYMQSSRERVMRKDTYGHWLVHDQVDPSRVNMAREMEYVGTHEWTVMEI